MNGEASSLLEVIIRVATDVLRASAAFACYVRGDRRGELFGLFPFLRANDFAVTSSITSRGWIAITLCSDHGLLGVDRFFFDPELIAKRANRFSTPC